jgi:hypothetical protein
VRYGPNLRGRICLAISILIACLAVTTCEDDVPKAERSLGSSQSPSSAPAASDNTSSPTAVPEDLDAGLRIAFDRFYDDPPTFHGTYEYRTDGQPTVRYELWVDWPAFRLTFEFTEREGPDALERLDVTVATQDGKRFGVRDVRADEPYVTRSFGERVWILGPMLAFFGPDTSPLGCLDGHGVGVETILGRSTIIMRCTQYQAQQAWVDQETGLILRQVMAEGEPDWLGFVDLQFAADLDPSLFRPDSV